MVKLFRESYEAKVLVIPLEPAATELLAQIRQTGVDGVMTLTPQSDSMDFFHTLAPLATHGWAETRSGATLDEGIAEADMVVLLTKDLEGMSQQTCQMAGVAAEKHGALIAALVVGAENWDTPEGRRAMVAMREAVDMVALVRGLNLAAPFLDVLRGGARHARRAGSGPTEGAYA